MRIQLNLGAITLPILLLLVSACTPVSTESQPAPQASGTPSGSISLDGTQPSPTTSLIEATETPSPTTQPTNTMIVTPVDTIPPTATPDVPLSSDGPWLLLLRDAEVGIELAAINSDGTGHTQLDVFPQLISHRIIPSQASPWFALQFGTIEARDIYLSIYRIPNAQPFQVVSLLSGELPDDPEKYYYDPVYQKELYAMFLTRFSGATQSWSPDGRYLAFLAALDGPSMDLYIFDTQSGRIDRLTSGPSEALLPIWSPTGEEIILQELDAYTEMGFWDIQAVYAVPITGEEITLLYEPYSNAERFLGWNSSDTFTMLAFKLDAASLEERWESTIRIVNIDTARTTRYEWPDVPYAVLDPVSGATAFFISRYEEEFAGQPAGLYLAPTFEADPVLIAPGEWSRIEWHPEVERFFAMGEEGVIGFTPSGEVIQFPTEGRLPKTSPDGEWLAFYASAQSSEPGIRMYTPDGQLLSEISTEPISYLTWSMDSNSFFYLLNRTLYRCTLTDSVHHLIAENVLDMYWIGY